MKKYKKALCIILTMVGVICLALFLFFFIQDKLADKASTDSFDPLRPSNEDLVELLPETLESQENEESSVAPENTSAPDSSETLVPPDEATPVVNPYKDSFLANSDMAAWLMIPNTTIDYPVMWTPEDENYYLNRDFNKKENKNGCLLLDTDSSLDPLTTNLIIHGHNMKSGAMFGNLTDYEDYSYYENHKQLFLYTKEMKKTYEVIAVFRSQVFKKSDNVFKFYKFFEADTQEQFDDFYNNIKGLSIYDTGVTAGFGDHFITLSTCVYHVENGRFVVIAKEISNEETYLPLNQNNETTQN